MRAEIAVYKVDEDEPWMVRDVKSVTRAQDVVRSWFSAGFILESDAARTELDILPTAQVGLIRVDEVEEEE